ncbi:tryptophan--tRNA ligase [Fodinicurvata sp. EGI_FJ10296]|uniref:tryptophan--tRNA ligase n=1 Tax=Fodinicurvata sp. EGI_FJ10296 TaxID=3231908 RepID=UPI0034516916
MKRIFSGIQPTHKMHLGNYLGAVRNWVRLQSEDYETIFCAVDLHALTVPQDPQALRANTRELLATLIAVGIDPKKSILFAQSQVPEHTELAWLFSCLTPMGWLKRMTQFKDKAGKHQDLAMHGLLAYPVLMAADILLYHATHVPVGEDQKQHLELTREIAGSFNHRFERDYFPLPEPQILGEAARVMSLRDGSKKMSKSDSSDYSRISLTDDADTIALKIRKARTDPDPVPSDRENMDSRPEARNLLTIYASLADTTIDAVIAERGGESFSTFKAALADLAVSVLSPISQELDRLTADPAQLDAILRENGARAREIARGTIADVKDTMGLINID